MGKKKKPNKVTKIKNSKEFHEIFGQPSTNRLERMGVKFEPNFDFIWEEDTIRIEDFNKVFPKIENTKNITIESTPWDDIKHHPANRFTILKMPEFMKDDYQKINESMKKLLDGFVKEVDIGVDLSGELDTVCSVVYEPFGKLPLATFVNHYEHLIINREKKPYFKMNSDIKRFMNLVRNVKGE